MVRWVEFTLLTDFESSIDYYFTKTTENCFVVVGIYTEDTVSQYPKLFTRISGNRFSFRSFLLIRCNYPRYLQIFSGGESRNGYFQILIACIATLVWDSAFNVKKIVDNVVKIIDNIKPWQKTKQTSTLLTNKYYVPFVTFCASKRKRCNSLYLRVRQTNLCSGSSLKIQMCQKAYWTQAEPVKMHLFYERLFCHTLLAQNLHQENERSYGTRWPKWKSSGISSVFAHWRLHRLMPMETLSNAQSPPEHRKRLPCYRHQLKQSRLLGRRFRSEAIVKNKTEQNKIF